MLHIYLTAYLIVGLVTAITTMRIFPPMEGFRPGVMIRVFAISVFTALWPVLISLAVWYALMGYFGRNREKIVETAARELSPPDTLASWQGTKPR